MKHLWLLGEKYVVVRKGDGGKYLRDDPNEPGFYTIKASLYPLSTQRYLAESVALR
jgi:hypothetical protein